MKRNTSALTIAVIVVLVLIMGLSTYVTASTAQNNAVDMAQVMQRMDTMLTHCEKMMANGGMMGGMQGMTPEEHLAHHPN